jgi:Tfp pilus assembly protein PilN
MKITLNLSIAPSPREQYALAWAIPTGALAAVGMMLLSLLAVRNFREYRSAHRSLAELQQVETKMREHEAALKKELERPQLDTMYRQAQFVNVVISQKQSSLVELAQKVSKLLPGQARLDSLSLTHAEKHPTVRLSVAGNSEEDIETFLGNLEDSTDFADVAVVSQGVAQENPEGGGQEPVTVVCTARYVGGQAH